MNTLHTQAGTPKGGKWGGNWGNLPWASGGAPPNLSRDRNTLIEQSL